MPYDEKEEIRMNIMIRLNKIDNLIESCESIRDLIEMDKVVLKTYKEFSRI
jgi:hypothetical protein